MAFWDLSVSAPVSESRGLGALNRSPRSTLPPRRFRRSCGSSGSSAATDLQPRGPALRFPWCPAPRGPAGRGGVARGRWLAAAAAARGARPDGGAEVRGAGGHGQRGGAAAGLGGAHHQGRLGLLRQVREGASPPVAPWPSASSPWVSVRSAGAAAPAAQGAGTSRRFAPRLEGNSSCCRRAGPVPVTLFPRAVPARERRRSAGLCSGARR